MEDGQEYLNVVEEFIKYNETEVYTAETYKEYKQRASALQPKQIAGKQRVVYASLLGKILISFRACHDAKSLFERKGRELTSFDPDMIDKTANRDNQRERVLTLINSRNSPP